MRDRSSTRVRRALLIAGLALVGAGCATPIEIPGTAGLPDAGRGAADSGAGGLPDGAAEDRDFGGLPPPPPGDDGGAYVSDASAPADGGIEPGSDARGDGEVGDASAGDGTADGPLPGSDAGDAAADDAAGDDAIPDDAIVGQDGGDDATAIP